jgi:Na+/melibiose symporter-like transporter
MLVVAWIAMFSVPAGISGTSAALWVGSCCVVGNLLFACCQVPYLTTPSDLRIGYHERTRVFTFRMIFLALGLLGAGVVAPALVSSGSHGAYARMALLLAGALVVSRLVAVAGVRRLTDRCGFQVPDERAQSARHDVLAARRDRDFRALLLSYLFTGTSTHLFLAALPFYAEYVLHDTGLTALLMGGFLVPATVAGPGWLRASRRIGTARAAAVPGRLHHRIPRAVARQGARAGATVAVLVVMGAAFAGLQLLASSIVPDAAAAAEARGRARAGADTGVWTATEATGTALGPYTYSAVLAVGGFVFTTEGHGTPSRDSRSSATGRRSAAAPTRARTVHRERKAMRARSVASIRAGAHPTRRAAEVAAPRARARLRRINPAIPASESMEAPPLGRRSFERTNEIPARRRCIRAERRRFTQLPREEPHRATHPVLRSVARQKGRRPGGFECHRRGGTR